MDKQEFIGVYLNRETGSIFILKDDSEVIYREKPLTANSNFFELSTRSASGKEFTSIEYIVNNERDTFRNNRGVDVLNLNVSDVEEFKKQVLNFNLPVVVNRGELLVFKQVDELPKECTALLDYYVRFLENTIRTRISNAGQFEFKCASDNLSTSELSKECCSVELIESTTGRECKLPTFLLRKPIDHNTITVVDHDLPPFLKQGDTLMLVDDYYQTMDGSFIIEANTLNKLL